ncbi:MAG TPA: hypothetical protein VMU09_09055, partial [Acidimicrobiales bacterium]|nr:hypothetical protein [Acidimicrobiales bacterium]
MQRTDTIGRRTGRAGRLAVAGVVAMLSTLGWGAAAGADTTVAGYTLSAQALGFQFGFNIPGLVPLPNENILEDDVPFARTTMSGGPVVDALGAPYYPGDIAANVGTLLQTFGVPLPVPNDSALAEAKYPTSPGYGTDATFGAPPPAGSPATPDVFNATSHADGNGGTVTSSVSDFTFGLPGLPVVQVGSVQATNKVALSASSVTASANSVVRGITIAGMIDIQALTADASSTSDGTRATPSSDLKVGSVTVAGMPAYIDKDGVHVNTTAPPSTGLSPAQVQATLNATLAQDGIAVRLADPTTSTSGAEGKGDAGGLVVSFTHTFALPFIPGLPALPALPGLGSISIPAGLYTVTTSVTLGSAVADAAATVLAPFDDTGGGGLTAGTGDTGLSSGFGADQGLSSTGGDFGSLASTPTGPGAGTLSTAGGSSGLASSL